MTTAGVRVAPKHATFPLTIDLCRSLALHGAVVTAYRQRALVGWSCLPARPLPINASAAGTNPLPAIRTSRLTPSPEVNQELVKMGDRQSSGHERS
jgi:hypothetical protein